MTHDQEEALSISDRVIVMNHGYIEQIDRPIEVYKNPTTIFVADFVGTTDFFEGEIKGELLTDSETGLTFKVARDQLENMKNPEGRVSLAIRPEKIVLFKSRGSMPGGLEEMNVKEGHIEVVNFLGVIVRALVKLGKRHLIVDITEKDFEKNLLKMGDHVSLYFPPEEFLVFQA